MTVDELKYEIRREAKVLNSRLARLEKQDLPTPAHSTIKTAQAMNSNLVTRQGKLRYSASVSGRTENELKQQLKWLKAQRKNVYTVSESKQNLKEYAKKWNVDIGTAKRMLNTEDVFQRAIAWSNGFFDSDRVAETINEFDHTPTEIELVDALIEKYGSEIQDEPDGREILLDWMQLNDKIPSGVNAEGIGNNIHYV